MGHGRRRPQPSFIVADYGAGRFTQILSKHYYCFCHPEYCFLFGKPKDLLTTERTKGTKVLKVNLSKQETKMKTNSEEKEIIEQYSLSMNVKLFDRIVFYISTIMVSVWFLVPLYNPTKFPLLVFIIVSVPIVIHNIIALPKHIRIIHSYGLYYDPWLNTKCALHAYYPSNDFINKYPWFKVVHYLLILLPIVCFLFVIVSRFKMIQA
jgi:hypothetical protein